MNDERLIRTKQAFQSRFGDRPSVVVRAPGRVNLIGEHTDYNEGFVLPFAVDRAVWIAATACGGGRITMHSEAYDESVTFSIETDKPSGTSPWQNYGRGIVHGLREAGVHVEGANLLIGGDLPPGAGMSSSAAVCVGAILALARLAVCTLSREDIIELVQRTERDFAGTPCGIMDPYICLTARRGYALFIDCRAKTHRHLPLAFDDLEFIVADSGVRHALTNGAFSKRARECRRAVDFLRHRGLSALTLRDVDASALDRCHEGLDPTLARRARHVVTENARVMQTVDALQGGDADLLLACVNASHASLRDQYEVSCDEIERLRERMLKTPGVQAARMIGGGFGGSVLAIVDRGWDLPLSGASAMNLPFETVRPSAGAEVFDIRT